MDYVLGTNLKDCDWASYLGTRTHKHAEVLAVNVKKNFESNIDACIVALDSLCDFLLRQIYLKHLPAKTYGNYGNILKNSPSLEAKFPQLFDGLKTLHELRLESATAHPNNTRKSTTNRRLKHKDFEQMKPKLRTAFMELKRKKEI